MSFGINSPFKFNMPTGNIGHLNPVWNAGRIRNVDVEQGATPEDNDVLFYNLEDDLWKVGTFVGPTGPTGPSGLTDSGTATLVAGTVVVANVAVTAESHISVTHGALNDTTSVGVLRVTLDPETGFTIDSITAGAAVVDTGDLSTIHWALFN